MKLYLTALALAALSLSCSREPAGSQLETVIAENGVEVPVPALHTELSYHLDHMTPTGKRLFEAAITWEKQQWDFRNDLRAKATLATPDPLRCAGNLSQVYYMTGVPSLRANYRWTLVDEVSTSIKGHGGRIVNLSKNKPTLIAQLNQFHGGRIPVGAAVGGCKEMDADGNCGHEIGTRHIGLVGNTIDLGIVGNIATEVVMTYHNNWYRPESAGGQYLKYMVSMRNINGGFPRQFMAVPWIEVDRNIVTGKIVDVRSAIINPTTGLAAIDDMDPFTYFTFIAVPKEIQTEIAAGHSATTDGLGGVKPLGQIDYQKIANSKQCQLVADPAGSPVNVRYTPGGAVIGSLADGAKVQVLGASGGYLRALTGFGLGFIAKGQFGPCRLGLQQATATAAAN